MRAKAWLGTVLLSLLPIMAYAQDQKEALVQELYVKSGLEKQMEQIPLTVQAGFDQAVQGEDRSQKLPKNIEATIRGLAPEAFAPESLKKVVLPDLKEHLTVPEIKQVLKWLDSPLGKECTRLEEAASTPAGLTEMERYGAKLKNSPPTAQRLNLIRKFDAAVKATESNVEIAVNIQIAIALAINATLPVQQQKPLKEIAREVERIRPEIEADMRTQTLVSLLYTYRSLSEAQMRHYLEFVKSPAGSKYQRVSTAAVKKAIIDGSIRLGKAVGEAMKQLEGQSEV